jgi:nickel transport protein
MRNCSVGSCLAKSWARIWIPAALTLMGISSVWAHNVNVYAYGEPGRIVVQGYFGGKAKAVDCAVEVLDMSGQKLGEGRTDAGGVCVFQSKDLPLFQGDLRIVLHAGAGHRAEYTLPASEIIGRDSSPRVASDSTRKAKEASGKVSAVAAAVAPDTRAVEKAVEDALDRKLEPLIAMMSNQQKLLADQKHRGPGLLEIVGGIGWIFGIFGVAAYFMSRTRAGKDQ